MNRQKMSRGDALFEAMCLLPAPLLVLYLLGYAIWRAL